MSQDDPGDVILRPLAEEHLAAAVACVAGVFAAGEPMTRALGLSAPQILPFVAAVCERALEDDISTVAIERGSGRLLGCHIFKDFAADLDLDLDAACPAMAPIVDLLGRLADAYAATRAITRGQVAHSSLGAVLPTLSCRGLASAMTEATIVRARARGYRWMVSDPTGPAGQHMWRSKFGYRVVAAIQYRSYTYRGHQLFAEISACPACVMMEGVI